MFGGFLQISHKSSMTRIILILLFMGYLPLTAQSPFKPNQWAFFLEAGGNYFQWFTRYNYEQFDPKSNWSAGFGVRLDYPSKTRPPTSFIGGLLLNHQKTFALGAGETLHSWGLQLKGGA